jgi:hypothetical protein
MFYPKNLQTQNEIAFFEKLKFVFQNYHISTQVALSAIIETDNYKERSQFNTYYVDYVICDKKGEKPLLIIELDDNSHKREKRIIQDKRKNGVIQSAGIPFIRYKSKSSYDITDIANNTIPYLKGTKELPIYETLPINDNQYNNNNRYNNIKQNIKKYLINKLKKVGCTIIVFIIFLCFVFLAINATNKSVTNLVEESQKISTPKNTNNKNINDTNTKNNYFQKIITDSMKSGQKSIKFDTEKNKKQIKKNSNIILPKYYPTNETKNNNMNQSNKKENDNENQ